MKKAIFTFIFLGGLSLASISYASVFRAVVSTLYPVEGDTVKITVSGSRSAPQTATLGTETADFFSLGGKYVAAIGLKVTAQAGWQKIIMHFKDGATVVRWIDVLKKKITVENFAVPPELGVTPTELVNNLTDENKALNEILNIVTPETYFTGRFGLPLADNTRVTDRYGILRKMGSEDFWHLGTDFAAPAGSAVGAMNTGIVRFATTTASYGGTVIIDHGEGIYSMYLHLAKIIATAGEEVEKGTIVGLVGDTGLSTGDHLHISIKINGISVDPLQFVKVF